jgi:hypothetical protein
MVEHPDAGGAGSVCLRARGSRRATQPACAGYSRRAQGRWTMGVQAILSGAATPGAAMQAAWKQPDAPMMPYVEQTALKRQISWSGATGRSVRQSRRLSGLPNEIGCGTNCNKGP